MATKKRTSLAEGMALFEKITLQPLAKELDRLKINKNDDGAILYDAFGVKQKTTDTKTPTFTIKGTKYDDYKDSTSKNWVKLPDSVVGTLLYFLIVKHNSDEEFKVYKFLKCLLFVGFPVYLAYLGELIFIYELWVNMSGYGDDDYNPDATANLCHLDLSLEIAAIYVFYMSMVPNFADVLNEVYIVLFASFMSDSSNAQDDDPTVEIRPIKAMSVKRWTMFFCICSIEFVISVLVTIVGTTFILSSEGIANVILNSVGVGFICDIDNMVCDAFQSDELSDNVSNWEFNTEIVSPPDDDDNENKLEDDTSWYFSTKALPLLAATTIVVMALRATNCH